MPARPTAYQLAWAVACINTSHFAGLGISILASDESTSTRKINLMTTMALQQSSALQKLKLLVQLEEEEANDDYEQGKLLLELHRRSVPGSCWCGPERPGTIQPITDEGAGRRGPRCITNF